MYYNKASVNYPLALGYSDIFVVPHNSLDSICHFLGVFAAMNLFVEIAIPTAIMLVANYNNVVQNKDLNYIYGTAWSGGYGVFWEFFTKMWVPNIKY